MDSPTATPGQTPEPAGGVPATKENVQAEIDGLRAQLQNDVACPLASPQRTQLLTRRAELLQQQAALEAATPEAVIPPDPAAALPFALPADLKTNPIAVEVATGFHATATALGLPVEEIQQLVNYRPARPDPAVSERTLRAEWKDTFDDRMDAAALALERFPALVQEHVHRSGLGSDPAVIRRLAEIGLPMLKAQAAMQAMRLDKNSALNKPWTPEHAAALDEYRRLGSVVYGTPPRKPTP